MRKTIKLPRVLKINWIKKLTISVVFNNGESRIIDFKKLIDTLNLEATSPILILLDEKEFAKVELQNNTLSWSNVAQYITLRNGEKLQVPFEVGADVLLKHSKPEKTNAFSNIGRLIKENRLESGLTQQELAVTSGTSRNYISRIENDKSDIELATLRKIIEVGIGKKLDIKVL